MTGIMQLQFSHVVPYFTLSQTFQELRFFFFLLLLIVLVWIVERYFISELLIL